MAGIVLIFIVVYVPDATKQLQIYPEDALKDAIIRYRDDADTQDFIDGIQQEVIIACVPSCPLTFVPLAPMLLPNAPLVMANGICIGANVFNQRYHRERPEQTH